MTTQTQEIISQTSDLQNVIDESVRGKGLLAQLQVSQWTARRLDREAGAVTAANAGAIESRGTYNKMLVHPDALKPIQQLVTEARKYHKAATVAWTFDGVGMLPGVDVTTYDVEMARYKTEFTRLVQQFLDEYMSLVAQARGELGSLFNISDYPKKSALEGKFAFNVMMMPLPDTSIDDIRTSVSPDIVAKLEEGIRHQYDTFTGTLLDNLTATADKLRERLVKYQDDIANKASNPDAKTPSLSSALFDNLVGAARMANKSNLAGDQRISTLASFIVNRLPEVASIKEDMNLCSQLVGDLQTQVQLALQ